MWRRLSVQLLRSAPKSSRFTPAAGLSSLPSAVRPSAATVSRHFNTVAETVVSTRRVEDLMPIATGHEREELEAELQGKQLLDINFPEGPFGTKEAPAVVKSYYDRRIVGCPGGEGEDEHDVVWFWLEKGKPCECPVCSQYFGLEVVGPGGPPDGHGDDEDEHH